MKNINISKIRIKEMFGIKEFEATGKDLELIGRKGTGKSSILDAIRYWWENKSDRDVIVRKGAEEGEIYIETDTGLRGTRKARLHKADYVSLLDGKAPVKGPETFLREMFSPLQLNPMKFVQLDIKEQNRTLLDLIDFKWDLAWIKEQFGEIVQDVDYKQNILRVLYDIQADGGFYFQKRQFLNREIKENIAVIEEIGGTLPVEYNAEKWRNVGLSDLYTAIERKRRANKEIEKARVFLKTAEGKTKQAEAEKEIESAVIVKELASVRTGLETAIVRLEGELKAVKLKLEGLEKQKITRLEQAESNYKIAVAEVHALIEDQTPLAGKSFDDTIPALEETAQATERMKSFINEYDRMVRLQLENESLLEDADVLTGKIEKARTLPGEILATCDIPVKGLTIENGEPRINGLPISNLSDGEKLILCIDIVGERTDQLNLLLLDGIELLSQRDREPVYAKCKEKGVHFIATRVSEDPDLTVIEL